MQAGRERSGQGARRSKEGLGRLGVVGASIFVGFNTGVGSGHVRKAPVNGQLGFAIFLLVRV